MLLAVYGMWLLLRSQSETGQAGGDVVLIPAGEFIMGLTREQYLELRQREADIAARSGRRAADSASLDKLYPGLRVWLDAFTIDRWEVSNSE